MNKIKIVQIENFYRNFLSNEYGNNKYLSTLCYESQIDHLLKTGWSSGQNVTPYLNPSHFEAHYIIPTHERLQRLWAEENLYSPLIELDEILFLQLKKIRPQIIYLSDIPCFNFDILDGLDYRPFIVAWHATSLSNNTKWGSVDLLLSGVEGIRNKALSLGVRAVEEFMSAAPNYMQSNKFHRTSISGDVCFSGSFIPRLHDSRVQLFHALSKTITPFKFDIYCDQVVDFGTSVNLNLFPAVFAKDVVSLYSSYRIVIDSRADFGLGDFGFNSETSNMRIFEATKAGALLVTQASSNIHKYFRDGIEIITYENLIDLSEKIRYFLNPINETERIKIAFNGQRRAVLDHSIESRALWFAELIFKYI